MRTRKAILPDAQQIHELIAAYSGDGTLLPRTLPEICENVRDFVVLEDDGRIIGCGALHLYGTHLAEIRSITVAPWAQGKGGGGRLVKSLMAEAKRHRVDCICLFTRKPDFFAHLGFTVAQREDLPDKIYKDCCVSNANRLRYSPGATPFTCRNARLKLSTTANPQSSAAVTSEAW